MVSFHGVMGLRSYGDPCGIARALDRVGERWALLAVRELLLGPKRFTDLRSGLPGASANVLAQRLRELEVTGVVRRRKLGPPGSVWVYELSEWGLELEPVILALGRWGSRSSSVPGGELSVDALMIALKTTFDPRLADGLRATYELQLGADTFGVRVRDGNIEVRRGRADHPDATIETDVATFRSVVFGRRPLAEKLRSGSVKVDGDRRAAKHLLRLFPLTEPAAVPGA
jgi:DNA-binding HxlR family transcriptional regulator